MKRYWKIIWKENPITDCKIRKLIQNENFPLLFGSALKLEGIDTFLEAFDRYTICPEYADTFGAKVYKYQEMHKECG